MEDQFGGRTDDDLFYDDFEPVESETIIVDEPTPLAPEPVTADIKPDETPSDQATPASSATPPTHKGLAASRYAHTPPPAPQPQPQQKPQKKPHQKSQQKPQQKPQQQQQQPSKESPAEEPASAAETTPSDKPPANAPTAPREKTQRAPAANNAQPNATGSRFQSGANPRQKLTDAELSAKMEQMKLLSAEKTRKFEKAEQDEKQHAQAYARGMQEARERRLEAEERRKRGEENQRKLNDEREKNRERKLKAMGMKDGGWDEGKEAAAEEDSRRGFRGVNGGVRGSRSRGGGLAGSRYAKDGEEQPDSDRPLDESQRSRGGRGRGKGRGRGGRSGTADGHAPSDTPSQQKSEVPPSADDFPALPSEGTKTEKKETAPSDPVPLPMPTPVGKWDDEMAALDEDKKAGES